MLVTSALSQYSRRGFFSISKYPILDHLTNAIKTSSLEPYKALADLRTVYYDLNFLFKLVERQSKTVEA